MRIGNSNLTSSRNFRTMPSFVIKKRITAPDMAAAIKQDGKTPVQEIWIDDKPEEGQKPDQIGFNLESSGFYYSPHLKRKKKSVKR